MCGIAGYVGQGTPEQLRRMTQALARRGPDDEHFFEAPGVGFGFRRLSIIDVAGGRQPIPNETGSCQVMLNGEIYGFHALREELQAKGHTFVTKSDTEVLVHAYETWGAGFLPRVNGMFAIALWDGERRQLLLARDRLGKKPLYWTVRAGTLWFASELKALLAARAVEKVLDPEALAYYFRADAIPTPKSVFQDVFKLPAGMSLSWSPGTTPAITPFWQVEDLRVDVPNTEAEVLRGLRDRIDLAVRERLVADVPLGLFLSGGIDSAVVAESASRQAGSLEAFTIGFDDPTHDESGIAAQTAKAFGLTHHVERLGAEEALGMLDEATELLDEPLADASILPTLLLARFTRRHVTVALSGDGGDELLLGYQHVPAHAMIEAYPFLRRPGELAARVLEKLPASDGYFSFGFKAQRLARGMGSADPWARDLAWRGSWSGPMASRLLRGADVSAPDRHLAALANDVPGDWGFWRQWTWMYLRSFLMDQVMVKVDRATMHFSLEGRAPLLDPRVVSYLFSLDDRWKLGRFAHKALFKRLLRERLPANVLALPKHGFAIPIAAWLKTALAEELQQSVAYARENLPHAVDADVVEAMRVEHAAGRIDRRKELWSWLQFIRWHRRWVA